MKTLVIKRKQEVPLEQLCMGDEVRLSGIEIVDDIDAEGFYTISRLDDIVPREIIMRRYSFDKNRGLKSIRGVVIGIYHEGGKGYVELNKIIEEWR